MGYTLYTFKTAAKTKIRINRATFIIAGVTLFLSLLTIGGIKIPYFQKYIPNILTSYEPLIVCVILLFISLAYPVQKRSIEIENHHENKKLKLTNSNQDFQRTQTAISIHSTQTNSETNNTNNFCNNNEILSPQTSNTSSELQVFITPIQNLLSRDPVIRQQAELKLSNDFQKIPKNWPGRKFTKAKQHFTTSKNDAYTMYNNHYAYDETCVSLKDTQPVIIIESLPRLPVLPIPEIKWPQIMSATDYINSNFLTTFLDINESDKAFNNPKSQKLSEKLSFLRLNKRSPKESSEHSKLNKPKSIDKHLKYIVSEAPKICENPSLNRMVERFWLMIIQQELEIVIHLREHFDDGDFYPKFGEDERIEIKLKDKNDQISVCYQIQQLNPKDIKDSPDNCNCKKFSIVDFANCNNKTVTIFQYTDWGLKKSSKNQNSFKLRFLDESKKIHESYVKNTITDDLPSDPKKFRDFISYINRTVRCSSDYQNDTVLVTCSDGVSKSGIFVLLETLMTQYDKYFAVSPITVLQQMRVQRCGLVKNSFHFVETIKYLAQYIQYKSEWQVLRSNSVKSMSSLKSSLKSPKTNQVNLMKSNSVNDPSKPSKPSHLNLITDQNILRNANSPLNPFKLRNSHTNSPLNPFGNYNSPSDESDSLDNFALEPIYATKTIMDLETPETNTLPQMPISENPKSFKRGHIKTGSLDRVELMNVTQHRGLDWRQKINKIQDDVLKEEH